MFEDKYMGIFPQCLLPFEYFSPRACLSSDKLAIPEIEEDLLQAEAFGERALSLFVKLGPA